MSASAQFNTPTGVLIQVAADSAATLRTELAALGVYLSTGEQASATVTPAKQEAARASTGAAKAENKAAAAETKAADKPAAEVKKPTVDYPTLQKAVFDLVGAVKAKGLDPAEHVLGIAKKFGYDNFAKMQAAGPEGAMQFEPALAAVKAKAEEVAALVVEEAVA